MPSRCLNRGTLLSALTRSMSDLPPRGTMTSMNSVMRSISPTAARSRVGTRWIDVAGRPAPSSPALRESMMAPEEWKLSEPPRRMTALPAFKHRPPASAVTLGRDS